MNKWVNMFLADDFYQSGRVFNSREEAIADGIKQYGDALNGHSTYLFDWYGSETPPKRFYIGKIVPYSTNIDIRCLLESMQEYESWRCDLMSEDFLESLSQYMIDDLKEKLEQEFDNWLNRYELYHPFCTVENVEKINF